MVILARKDDVPRINDVNLPRAFVDGVEGELAAVGTPGAESSGKGTGAHGAANAAPCTSIVANIVIAFVRFILPLLPDVVYLFVEYQIGLKAVKTTMGSCVDWVGAMPQI